MQNFLPLAWSIIRARNFHGGFILRDEGKLNTTGFNPDKR
jgi:hypothetical protein